MAPRLNTSIIYDITLMPANDELSYLDSLGLHTVKPGLKRILQILDKLGNPQNSFKSIIVGGTNGKGSVAAAISSILIHSNYKTALYTSPHLIKVNERISVNNKDIPDSDLIRLITNLREVSQKYNIKLSYFEFITALAFLWFHKQKVDISILEVGMGGRWDATNVVTPLISIITNISFDHMEYLGNTLAEIAQEKAEIIKYKIPVVTACSEQATAPIRSKANYCSAPLYRYGIDFSSKGSSTNSFDYISKTSKLSNLQSNLAGSYQIENLSVAIQSIYVLNTKYNFNVSEDNIRAGLLNTRWPGRLEIIDNKKPIILDCAHNDGSSRALAVSLKALYPNIKFNFLVGILNDKDHTGFVHNISKVSDTIFITNQFSEKETPINKLESICKEIGLNHKIMKNYKTAFNRLRKEDCPLCITGSIYLVGAIKEILLESNKNHMNL